MIDQLADIIILEYEGIIVAGESHEAAPLFRAVGDAGGILEIGHDVEELRLELPQPAFQLLQIDAVLVQRNIDDFGAARTESGASS